MYIERVRAQLIASATLEAPQGYHFCFPKPSASYLQATYNKFVEWISSQITIINRPGLAGAVL